MSIVIKHNSFTLTAKCLKKTAASPDFSLIECPVIYTFIDCLEMQLNQKSLSLKALFFCFR